jgi:UDP-N-acetylglucosamine:LPS N-acetylglucosamine transferase
MMVARNLESRLDALERQLRASQGANVVIIKGGSSGSDPTEEEIAEAVRKSKAEGGRLVVIGGLR